MLLAKQIVEFDLSCIIRINGYPAWIFIYINKFHQFLMYGNVATEVSHNRNGQTESARPKRLRPKWLRTNRTDRNSCTLPDIPKCVDAREKGRKGWAREKLSLRVWHELVRCIWSTKDLFLYWIRLFNHFYCKWHSFRPNCKGPEIPQFMLWKYLNILTRCVLV